MSATRCFGNRRTMTMAAKVMISDVGMIAGSCARHADFDDLSAFVLAPR